MSELTTATIRNNPHRHLLAGACAAAMLQAWNAQAIARETEKPTVWIELGGQLERVSGESVPFVSPFMEKFADSPTFTPVSAVGAQRVPRYSKGFEGKITLLPDDSGWVFSAGIRYGRANGNKKVHQQTPGKTIPPEDLLHNYTAFNPAAIKATMDARSKDKESQTLLDFKAGRDVGMGILGPGSEQVLSIGVRFAQFTSSKVIDIKDRPEIRLVGTVPTKYWTNFIATGRSDRSFKGIGPSLSLDGSMPISGAADEGISFDWGLVGAVLFGRQKASVLHQVYASEWQKNGFQKYYVQAYKNAPPRSVRNRSVVVPNLNGFAGLSFRRSNARISFGYRGEIFFGAMDTGIDASHSQNVSFHGPFAKISIDLGG